MQAMEWNRIECCFSHGMVNLWGLAGLPQMIHCGAWPKASGRFVDRGVGEGELISFHPGSWRSSPEASEGTICPGSWVAEKLACGIQNCPYHTGRSSLEPIQQNGVASHLLLELPLGKFIYWTLILTPGPQGTRRPATKGWLWCRGLGKGPEFWILPMWGTVLPLLHDRVPSRSLLT